MAITLLVIDVDNSGLDFEILIKFNYIIYIATCILRPNIFGNDWLRHAVSTVAIFVYQNICILAY